MSTYNLQNLVWEKTHRDYRGMVDGERAILVNMGAQGTCLAVLHTLTALELLNQLPTPVYPTDDSPEAAFAELYKRTEDGINERYGPSDAGLHERMCGVYRTIVEHHIRKLSGGEIAILRNSIKSHVYAERGLANKPFTITFHKVEDANS